MYVVRVQMAALGSARARSALRPIEPGAASLRFGRSGLVRYFVAKVGLVSRYCGWLGVLTLGNVLTYPCEGRK